MQYALVVLVKTEVLWYQPHQQVSLDQITPAQNTGFPLRPLREFSFSLLLLFRCLCGLWIFYLHNWLNFSATSVYVGEGGSLVRSEIDLVLSCYLYNCRICMCITQLYLNLITFALHFFQVFRDSVLQFCHGISSANIL